MINEELINAKDRLNGFTPLMYGAEKGDREMVITLLNNFAGKINFDLKDKEGRDITELSHPNVKDIIQAAKDHKWRTVAARSQQTNPLSL